MNELLFERRGDVGVLTFNRPEARNAVTFEMYDALPPLLERIEADEAVRALVVRGAGGAFVAGTDIGQLGSIATEADALAYEARFEKAVARLERLRQPTIAAVSGDAVGGGAALMLACDLRVCEAKSRFGAPIARTVGNCLSVGNTARLVAAIGALRTRELLMTARLATAQEAVALSLVNEIAVDPEARAIELAAQIAQNAPLTVRIAKEAVRRVLDGRRDGDDLIALAYTSADFREGVSAFVEKRKPRWTGR